ncbi:protein toll-like [Pectinophora gossypiella]|uniref:protein toll-like n=1 Tax=Pectinophora gossypiella TaxID=13191 RepID=UPI00214F2E02|nr:protein toll-like [Pectinophora gossypiella]
MMLINNLKFVFLLLLQIEALESMEFNDDPMFTFTCTNETPDQSVFATTTYYDFIYINMGCVTPKIVFAEMIQSLRLMIPKKLQIDFNKDSVLEPSQFENLNVESLYIQAYGDGKSVFNTAILTVMTKLRVLRLKFVQLPEMPKTLLREVQLTGGVSLGEFGDCSSLERLTLVWWDVSMIPEMWLERCKSLRSLTLKQMSKIEDSARVLDGAFSVTELTLYKCKLNQVLTSNLLKDQKALRKLTIHHNGIKYISFQETLPKLQDVDLSNNELVSCEDVASLMAWQSTTLVNLTVASNKLLDMCEQDDTHQYKIMDGSNIPTMKRLSFADTATSTLCFDEMLNVESLEYLDLGKNRITQLQFQRLPLSSAKHLKEINFIGTPIQEIDFDKTHYDLLSGREELKLTGVQLSLPCDCSYAWLARAIRDKRLSLKANCQLLPLEAVPVDSVECDKFKCQRCVCRKSWKDDTIAAECAGEQTEIVRIPGLKQFIAPGNRIENITASDITETLMELNLKDNHISKLDVSVVTALFNVSERRLHLAGNPFVCDCENLPLIQALQTHQHQVKDYENLTCVSDGTPINDVDLDLLCAEPINPLYWIITAFFLGVSAIVALGAAVFFRYERPIKVFLFARGCCPWWLHEEEIDADRPYDAFVSFAHEDDDFVCTELLPELEEYGYRLCIHYRDWVAGEWIPAQISRSVQQSRRTIIVISKSFLASTWGMLEFRMAHISTLKEGRPRIIALMLEDVTLDEVDDELKGYLSSNTYIKWGEKWFWDKLKYALPHIDGKVEPTDNLEMGSLNGDPDG